MPCASPSSWISTWRGRSTYRSRSSRSSPNAAAASRRAASIAAGSSVGLADQPHPPAAAAGARLDEQRVADAGRRARRGPRRCWPRRGSPGSTGTSLAHRRAPSPAPCRRARASPRAAARPTRGRPPRPRRRTPRSRPGSRSPGGSPRRPSPAPPRSRGRRAGTTRRAGPGPIRTASSAARTCGARASASEYTATVRMPSRRAGPHDPQRDLAPVRDEDRREHSPSRYIRKTPNDVSGIGALRTAAASPRPSTSRVSTGSMTPSSHRRAVE